MTGGIQAVFFDFYGVLEDHGQPNEPVVRIALLLQARYRVGVISNASARLETRLVNGWGEVKRFDTVVTSGRVGTTKDEVAIFRFAARQLGLPANACFHVDDDRWNVETARRAGFGGVHYSGDDEELDAALRKAGLEW